MGLYGEIADANHTQHVRRFDMPPVEAIVDINSAAVLFESAGYEVEILNFDEYRDGKVPSNVRPLSSFAIAPQPITYSDPTSRLVDMIFRNSELGQLINNVGKYLYFDQNFNKSTTPNKPRGKILILLPQGNELES